MNFYPYNTNIILTDTIFADYGGDITKGTSNQRKIAYRLAESQASSDLETFLLPTKVSGTYYQPFISPLILEHTHINSIDVIRFRDEENDVYYTITGTNSIYASLKDDVYGIVDLHVLFTNCRCHTSTNPSPYKVEVVYTAGLPSGTSYQPDVLLALSTYADIVLNEIIGYGNEAPGDVGVERFTNMDYSETRRIQATSFGNSPRANFASRLLTRYRKHRWVSL